MPEYQFADKGGKIVTIEYDKTNYFSADQVLSSLESVFNIFPISANIKQVDDYDDVFHVTFPEGNDGIEEIFICAKGTTPGGRSGLKDEQRIQPKAKHLNYVFDRKEEGKTAIILGIYNRDGETVLCAWKVMASAAASLETPISKQIKISSIAKAMREGFVQQDKGKGEYACAFRPEFLYFYLRNCDWLHTGHVSELDQHTKPESFEDHDRSQDSFEDNKVKTGCNVILYGVPGCGKSHHIKEEYCDDEASMERVVFHPDYTYSDFVGQILPQNIDGHITYPFVPGPFTRILKKSVEDEDKNYYLIIEELNRGNAPAIFGEVFQLLDRKDGVSEYGISNADIANEVYGDATHLVKIPENLFILATMNTADQNVFTLDTAFQRRWRMKSIPNDIDNCQFGEVQICGSNVTWKCFVKTINAIIAKLSADNIGSEDKRLGAYFVQEKELYDEDLFSEKVLMYLWNDAFKFNREIFKPKFGTLEELILGFKRVKFDVFSDEVNFQKVRNSTEEIDNTTEPVSEIPIEQYLEGKSELSIQLYNELVSEIQSLGVDYGLKAVKDYITLRASNGRVSAELHLQKANIKLYIKEPLEDSNKIGRQLPESYGWTMNYEIILDEDSDISIIISAIMDSYNQVNS